jgi:serine phosphatase RsbU (regulator of sigma subunit)
VNSLRASDREILRLERLEETLRRSLRGVPSVMVESIREALRQHQQGRPAEDDVAIVVVGRE